QHLDLFLIRASSLIALLRPPHSPPFPYTTLFRSVLRASAFCEVTTATIPVRREWSIAEVIGYLYSTSFAASHLFGDRQDAFETADRKSTRLNSSHQIISYAVFCLKKKRK